MKKFKATIKHDNGKFRLTVTAKDQETALQMIMAAENCPACAVTFVKKVQLLSPDGFILFHDKPFYTSYRAAKMAFNKWAKRFEAQGYYSCRGERIPLVDLEHYMTVIEID